MARCTWSSGFGLIAQLVLPILARASDLDVVLSEVHYHPLGSGEPRFEFVEIHNRGPEPVALGGWRFVEGISFTFGGGTSLDPGAYLAVAAKAAALRTLHPTASITGDFAGRLDNSGEVLALVNGAGQLVSRLHYREGGAWSSLPDGKGPSLELIPGEDDIDRPQVWAPSLVVGGTPGGPNTRGRESFPFTGKDPRAEVRLNEVKPSGGGGPGFIEIYNRGAAAAAIGRFRLLTGSGQAHVIDPGTSIQAGAWLSIPEGLLGFLPSPAAETYVLVEADGVSFVDALEAQALPSTLASGRFPDGAGDHHVMTPSPESANANAFFPEERVVINEVFFAPRYEAPSGNCIEDCSDRRQWVELYNRSGAAVDISGWSLDKAVELQFTPGSIIEAGGFLTVAASRVLFQSDHPGVPVAEGEWAGSLGRREDSIVLRDSLGNEADRIHYGNGGPYNDLDENGRDDRDFTSSDWPKDVSDSGRSIELLNPYLENAAGRAWRLGPTGGTPGARNAGFDPEPPPVVAGVTHAPPVPDSSSPVTVTCRAHASGAVTRIELVWKDHTAATSSRIPMRDDGASGDEAASDSTYGAVIPPQPDRTIVAFQIEVTSAEGETDTYPQRPAVGGRIPYYLYDVDDDPLLPNGSVNYRVIMTRVDSDALRNRGVTSDVLLNATFIGDGEVHHTVGIRYRGENSRNLPRKAYRIEFRPERTFQGIEFLNLNASNGGGTFPTGSLRDLGSSELFRRAGMPSPQEWPVNLYFQRGVEGFQNRSNADPFYVRKEHFNRDFLSRYFGGSDGGNLYRATDRGAVDGDLSYAGEDPSSYRRAYEKRSNRDEDDFSDVVELLRTLDTGQTPDAQFEDAVNAIIDANQWARFFAIQDYLTNVDGGIQTNSGEDYFLYHVPLESPRPDAGLWLILPWDLEETFSNAGDGLFLTQVAAVRRFLRHPSFARLYLANLQELRQGAASRREMREVYDHALEIYPAGAAPGIVGSLDSYVQERDDLIRAQIVVGIEVGVATTQAPGTKLIQEGDPWSYFKGTAEPAAGTLDWTILELDDGSWPGGPSGFGYGDGDDATVFDDMVQGNGNPGFLSVYIRKVFTVANPGQVDGLSLVVDYDDAFVAYLNGVEVARSAGLSGLGATGEPIPFDLVIGDAVNHEAARGNNSPNQPEPYPIADFRSLLFQGENLLAIQGFNSTVDSRDFSLIPELIATGKVSTNGGGSGSELFATGATLQIQGISDAGATGSVKVAGTLASITRRPPSGGAPYGVAWRATVSLLPGVNRVPIEVYAGPSGAGAVLDSRQIIVQRIDRDFTPLGGQVTGAAVLSRDGGPYVVTSGLRVPVGASLTIQPGAQVLLGNGATISVAGRLEALGTESEPIRLRPLAFGNTYGGILLDRTGTGDADPVHRLRHVYMELAGAAGGATGAVAVRQSRLAIEGCSFRSFSRGGIDARDSILEVEGSLFESLRTAVFGDDSTVLLSRSTFRDVKGDNDAIHLRGNAGAGRSRIEDCMIEGSDDDGIEVATASVDLLRNRVRLIADSGVSLNGEGALGPSLVAGNIIHGAEIGLEMAQGGNVANGDHDTIVFCATGMRLSGEGARAGQSTFHSMILWRNGRDLEMDATFSLSLTWSDSGDESPWPGAGNIASDPKFRGAEQWDFALAALSPCRGSGKEGTDMGATGAPAGGVVFLRGDVSGEGAVNITDAIGALRHLFQGAGPFSCEDAADVDDSGALNVTDVIYLLNHLFQGGPPIKPPFPEPGVDPSEDGLGCDRP